MHYNDNWKRGWRPRQACEKYTCTSSTRNITFNLWSQTHSAYSYQQGLPFKISLVLLHAKNATLFVSFWNISNILYPSCWRQSLFTKSAKPAPRSDHDLHKPTAHLHSQYLYVFSHTQLCIVWQLVSNCSTGHNQAIVQEHECIQKLSTMRQQDRPLYSKNVFKLYT